MVERKLSLQDAVDQRVAVHTSGSNNEYTFNPFGQQVTTWDVAANFGNHARFYWDGLQSG